MQKPSLEMIIIGVILLLFSAYALNKCNARKVNFQSNQNPLKTTPPTTSSNSDLYDNTRRATTDTLVARSPTAGSNTNYTPAPNTVPTSYEPPLRPSRTPSATVSPDPIGTFSATTPDAEPVITARPSLTPKAVLSAEDDGTVIKTTPRPIKKATIIPEMKEETDVTSTTSTAGGARLYVSISGLKVRTEPNLQAKVIQKLSLFDEVMYQNEVTKYTQPLSLGKEMANEPWVKVRTKKGKLGWVYGAGVSYYKIKRKGVM